VYVIVNPLFWTDERAEEQQGLSVWHGWHGWQKAAFPNPSPRMRQGDPLEFTLATPAKLLKTLGILVAAAHAAHAFFACNFSKM